MASKIGRKYVRWEGPVGWYMRCLAVHMYQKGYTGESELASLFTSYIPNWRDFFDTPPTDNALKQRVDKALRNKSENPWTHSGMSKFWARAGVDFKTKRKWRSWQELEADLQSDELPLEVKQLDPLTESRDEEQQYACRSFVVSVLLVAEITRVLKQHGVNAVFDPVFSEI